MLTMLGWLWRGVRLVPLVALLGLGGWWWQGRPATDKPPQALTGRAFLQDGRSRRPLDAAWITRAVVVTRWNQIGVEVAAEKAVVPLAQWQAMLGTAGNWQPPDLLISTDTELWSFRGFQLLGFAEAEKQGAYMVVKEIRWKATGCWLAITDR